MTNTEAIATIRSLAGNKFASSLVGQFDRKGDLSEKQWPWVHKLAAKGQEVVVQPTETVDVSGMLDLFERAGGDHHGKALKFPKVTLRTSDGRNVRFALAGPRSKYAGAIHVAEGSYGSRYYGRIDRDGTVRVRDAEVLATVRELAANPMGTAIAYGKLTGNCCFCSLPLTDDRSVEKGYGPVCAKNWGLPWGK